MQKTTFFELSDKEVINSRSGERLGYIADCEIDLECGRIISVIVRLRGKSLLSKCETIKICWENILRIGSDLILVDCEQFCLPDSDKFKFKKFL